ncbi:MAG TPA: MG2 domain-containing protein [Vicinamibacterales bacterium]|nr:MG2 domain-containing protein [Vicinamibacterales bacterium]
MRRYARLLLTVVAALAAATVVVRTQPPALTVVNAAPQGEANERSDANEIRVIFSEPMVALGRIPDHPTPAWIHITPAVTGTYRWSGTTMLIFTPDPSTPLPASTTYTVTVDASATSASGRALAAPYVFRFTTPTVKLTSMQWYRRDGRFDRPVVLVLDFNQRVDAAALLAHARLRYHPHDWDVPALPARDRARLQAADPDGLRRFDDKVAAAARAAARTGVVGLRVAADWDRQQFPPADTRLVIETTTAPAAGTWVDLTIDAAIAGVEGPAHPPRAQTATAELAPVFFATGFTCQRACDPSGYNGLQFSREIATSTFAAALTVTDITDPAHERAVARRTAVPATTLDRSSSLSLEDAGYERQPPATTYAYRLDPSLTAPDGQTLGYPWTGIVETWHERAFTSFGDGHGVWETTGGPLLPFSARNFRDVTQWLERVAPNDLVPRIVALGKNDFRDVPPGPGTARRLTVTPDAIQAYGIDLTPALRNGTGLVWAGVRPGQPIAQSERAVRPADADRSTVVQVTNLGISVKDSPQSTLVFVTRLDTAAPVADAAVTIVNTDNRVLWRGRTGTDGVVMAPALPLRQPDNWYELSFVVMAEKDGDVAYVASDWNEGIQPWDFGESYQLWEANDVLRGEVFTDRGVYRPGEDIHAKAIVRTDTPTGIRLLPAGSTIDIRVTDSRNREVDRRTVTLNRWSSAEWTWTVPATGTLGSYTIRALLPGTVEPSDANTQQPRTQADWLREVNGTFLVAAYRRPDFRVDATLGAGTPVAGAALSGTIDARYLFGSAMRDRPVRWSITREAEPGVPAAITERYPEARYAFGYSPDQPDANQRIAGGDGTLDASGRLAVAATSATNVDRPYRYTLEGDVEDVSRQHLANRASVVVHPAPWYVGVRRPAYFADVATGTDIDVVAADLDGRAVAGVPITVTLTRIEWNSVRRAEGGGFYTWDTEEVRTPAGEWPLESGDAPVALHVPVPAGGYYVITAVAHDAAGHTTKTETSFYGLGSGYTAWQRYDHNRIDLQPEKTTWKPGDTARIMIESPWESATALLTVEREGVRQYRRFNLTSTQQTVEVPITEADIPNVYVSVLLIRGRTSTDPGADGADPGKPSFRLGYAELKVEDTAKKLDVQVSADRHEYRPDNRAHVSVDVTDAASRPAASEVTLWAVDYGVLSLTGYDAPDVLHAVYQEKALQVMNEDNRQRIVSRRVLTPKGSGEGGGGGREDGAGTFRRDFRPLAFWLGSVETDASGHAVRDVALPESLTTYRIMAVAGDAASRFGSGTAEITVTKPVTLVAAFPRFLTDGDKAAFTGVVTNTLATGGQATVTIRSLDPALVAFDGSTTQTVAVGAGATAPIRFDATTHGTGTARVQMTVALAGESDAFETTIPIHAPAPVDVRGAFGDTDGRAVEQLAIPAGIAPGTGGLDVRLASTALVGLDEGARYVIDYPYACAEQKASAALALSLAADLGDAFPMAGVTPADARRRASALLNDLSRYQCGDGGFGYWAGSCQTGSAYLTAYVLHVMRATASSGPAADDPMVRGALDFLDASLKQAAPPGQPQWLPVWTASQAFAVKVLAEYGRNEDSNITRLTGMADRLPIFALSYLADAMAASGTRGARYDDVVRRITNALRVEGDQAHVEEVDADALAWVWNSNARATAVVLDGFVRRGDAPAMVPRLVRWLLGARRDGRWTNTQENATALEALVSYYHAFEAEAPDMTATVAIGDRPIGTATFRGRSTTSNDVRLAMPDLLRQIPAGAERDLTFSREGTGRLYYAARLQYQPTTTPAASDQGVRVERRYERFTETDGTAGPAATTFNAGDLIRVTLTITVPAERRYVAVSDALPAGVEAVDSWFQTTASDLAKDASVETGRDEPQWWFAHGGFDHVEKFDDHVTLFATRLGEGPHEFSYLVRATTAGTFTAAGTTAEEMYAPEVSGRAAAAVVVIR